MAEMPLNRFKRALRRGATQYGLWCGLPDASAAEIAAGAGFDWLLIDHEHAPFDLRSILSHLQAIAPYEVAPIVRPADHDPTLLKKLLDIGVQTFLVPMVDTAAQAQALVHSLRYPPAGRRGLGTSIARAARWNRIPDYLQRADEEICLIVQVESAAAMAQLGSIAAVEGVDGVFIGPSDLSASMGYLGDPGHPEVVTAIGEGLETIVNCGKAAGLMCLDAGMARDYVLRGASFVAVGVDTLILANGASRLAAEYRGDGGADESAPGPGY